MEDKRKQVGDTCKITRAERPGSGGKQVVDKRRQVGGTCKSRGQGTSGKPKTRGHSIQSVLGDKWVTDVQSRGQSIQSVLGDRWETSGDKWETNLVGDRRGASGEKRKCKIMRAEHPESSGRQVEDKRRQVGDKCQITRAEHRESTGRQVGEAGTSGRQSPETHVKSCGPCGPRTHPFQRSNNPSQVNLFGGSVRIFQILQTRSLWWSAKWF